MTNVNWIVLTIFNVIGSLIAKIFLDTLLRYQSLSHG